MKIPKPIEDRRFLLLFQEQVDWDQEPDHLIGIKLGTTYQYHKDETDPFVDNYILPKDFYNKVLMWAHLVSYDNSFSRNGVVYFNITGIHLGSIINMIEQYEEDQK
jgi:hypothetical protein